MATPTQEFRIFKGDTFHADGLYRAVDGDPVDLETAGITIEAWIKAKDNRRFPLEVTFSEEIGRYQLHSDDSGTWPLGRNQLIVRYTQGELKRTAQPVTVFVENV